MRFDLYQISHWLKEKLPFIWVLIEKLNEWLFVLRYSHRVKSLMIKDIPEGYELQALRNVEAEKIVSFFSNQPVEAYTYFNPHGFDRQSVKRLQKNRSFLAYLLIDKDNAKIAGYCFNRCFFLGKGFRGRMVDIDYRGNGLGTAMNRILNEIGFGIGLRLFETVSKDNIPSYKSAISASNVKVVKEMPNNELYLEILPE